MSLASSLDQAASILQRKVGTVEARDLVGIEQYEADIQELEFYLGEAPGEEDLDPPCGICHSYFCEGWNCFPAFA